MTLRLCFRCLDSRPRCSVLPMGHLFTGSCCLIQVVLIRKLMLMTNYEFCKFIFFLVDAKVLNISLFLTHTFCSSHFHLNMGAGRRDLGTAPRAHWHCNFQGSAGNPDPFSYSWAQGVGGWGGRRRKHPDGPKWSPEPTPLGWLARRRWRHCGDLEFPGVTSR